MSRRDRRNRSGAAVASGGGQEIERLLAKGRVKDAFKQAKLAYRQQATPENRRLLERTYLLRVKDLHRGRMPEAAAEVARAFLELGVSEPEALGELAAILPQIGMVEEARRLAPRLQSPGAATMLEHSLVDQAVLHPDRAATPDAKAGAERIRAALAALDAEEESRAMELLRDIGRNSPWADWRYFARGLAAYRRGDGAQAAANFDRLDRSRAAHRIATRLSAVAATAGDQSNPTANPTANPTENADASALEAAVFGQAVLGRLQRVRRLVERGNPKYDWKQALPLIASLTITLRRLDGRLAERLTEILIPPLFDEATSIDEAAAKRLLENFSHSAAPMRLDPAWNRLRALCHEDAAGPSSAVPYWKRYLADLDGVVDLPADERRRMQAMVWRHIGLLLREEADEEAPPFFGREEPEPVELLQDAAHAFEESLRVDPSLHESYDSLISLLQAERLPERVAEVRTRLLAAFPDDLETLKALIVWHLLQDEPERCLEYAARARKLRPLDSSLVVQEHAGLMALARHHAIAGRFDEARATFARAEALDAAASAQFGILARRAVCEWKAGQQRQADELIEKAKTALTNAAPLWLALAVEAERYKLGSAAVSRFNRELTAALKKKKNGAAAAALAELVCAYHAADVKYKEKKHHLEAVTKYVLATSRTHYDMHDLERVCEFLEIFHDKEPLLPKLIRRGLKDYPHSPVFHFLKAGHAVRDLPRERPDFRGINRHLQQALELAQADAEGRYTRWVEPIKQQIAMVERLREVLDAMRRRFGLGGGPPGGMPSFFRMLDSFLDSEDDDDDDGSFDDDFFEPPFTFDSPPQRGGGKKR